MASAAGESMARTGRVRWTREGGGGEGDADKTGETSPGGSTLSSAGELLDSCGQCQWYVLQGIQRSWTAHAFSICTRRCQLRSTRTPPLELT